MMISDFAIKRPLITVVSMVALVIFGLFALLKLKTDEFPDVAPPWLTVGVIYPGASPKVVEKEVLDPVEEQVGSIAGVKRIMSKAYDGYALLMSSNTHYVSSALRSKLAYHPVDSFVHITAFLSAPSVLVVHPSLEAKTLKDLIATGVPPRCYVSIPISLGPAGRRGTKALPPKTRHTRPWPCGEAPKKIWRVVGESGGAYSTDPGIVGKVPLFGRQIILCRQGPRLRSRITMAPSGDSRDRARFRATVRARAYRSCA